MKRLSCLTALVVFLMSCSRPELISAQEATEAIGRFDRAWQAKNESGLDSVLADQYQYFTQSGGVVSRANLLATARSRAYILENGDRDPVSVTIKGNVAVVNTTWRGRGIYQGRAFNDYQRCSVTLIKEGGRVRILSEHCTLIR